MKLSEYRKAREEHWTDRLAPSEVSLLVDRDVAAAEAAGKVWDPEGPLMPDRLAVTPNEAYIGEFPDQDVSSWRFFFLIQHFSLHTDSPVVAREAVRRWNAWNEIRALADCIGDDGPAEDRERRRILLKILDGRECRI